MVYPLHINCALREKVRRVGLVGRLGFRCLAFMPPKFSPSGDAIIYRADSGPIRELEASTYGTHHTCESERLAYKPYTFYRGRPHSSHRYCLRHVHLHWHLQTCRVSVYISTCAAKLLSDSFQQHMLLRTTPCRRHIFGSPLSNAMATPPVALKILLKSLITIVGSTQPQCEPCGPRVGSISPRSHMCMRPFTLPC